MLVSADGRAALQEAKDLLLTYNLRPNVLWRSSKEHALQQLRALAQQPAAFAYHTLYPDAPNAPEVMTAGGGGGAAAAAETTAAEVALKAWARAGEGTAAAAAGGADGGAASSAAAAQPASKVEAAAAGSEMNETAEIMISMAATAENEAEACSVLSNGFLGRKAQFIDQLIVYLLGFRESMYVRSGSREPLEFEKRHGLRPLGLLCKHWLEMAAGVRSRDWLQCPDSPRAAGVEAELDNLVNGPDTKRRRRKRRQREASGREPLAKKKCALEVVDVQVGTFGALVHVPQRNGLIYAVPIIDLE